jgi:CrcB protein
MNIVFIAIGGAFGAVARHMFSSLNDLFPYGTFLVNILGSALMGFLFFSIKEFQFFPRHIQLMLTTGFIGAFTTFSTFSLELFQFILDKNYLTFVFYAVASFIFGLFGIFLGKKLVDILI